MRDVCLLHVSCPDVNLELTHKQVVNIVTLGSGTGYGGFFLQPFTGPINGSAGSLAAPANLPPALPELAPVPAPTAAPVAPEVPVSAPGPVTTGAAPTTAAPSLITSIVTALGPGSIAPSAAPSAAVAGQPTAAAPPPSSLSLWNLLLQYVNGAHAPTEAAAEAATPCAVVSACRCVRGRRVSESQWAVSFWDNGGAPAQA